MCVSSNTFQYFSNSLVKLSDFSVIGCTSCRPTNILWAWKVKEQCSKHMKRLSDSLLNFFWKPSSRSLYSSSLISSSFSVCFEWFKIWWGRQVGLYKNSLYLRGKDAMVKDLKFKILLCFKSLITEHWIPLCQTPHILPIPSPNWKTFAALEVLNEGLNFFLELQNQGNTVCGFNLIWVHKCLLTGLSTLIKVTWPNWIWVWFLELVLK
jgi:hypothetical protein